MTTSAWAFMISAWTFIIGTTLYCFAKLLSSERQLDADPEAGPDLSEADK